MDRQVAPHPHPSGEFLLQGVSLPFVSMTAVFIGAAALFFSDVFTLSHVRQEPVASVLVLAIASVLVANSLVRWLLLLRMKRPLRRTPRAGWRVCVVTT